MSDMSTEQIGKAFWPAVRICANELLHLGAFAENPVAEHMGLCMNTAFNLREYPGESTVVITQYAESLLADAAAARTIADEKPEFLDFLSDIKPETMFDLATQVEWIACEAAGPHYRTLTLIRLLAEEARAHRVALVNNTEDEDPDYKESKEILRQANATAASR